ncbi:hypothetical protein E3N88_31729 [Mikania micrantha]|uniref:Uncharacterized protein n=1 Tax=Mikania micrantha TaxID=192012 RepID=A0A5N6M6H4_9ASTR|nr:hypothetical protein E3N88_31729 [Mikania micrantha]
MEWKLPIQRTLRAKARSSSNKGSPVWGGSTEAGRFGTLRVRVQGLETQLAQARGGFVTVTRVRQKGSAVAGGFGTTTYRFATRGLLLLIITIDVVYESGYYHDDVSCSIIPRFLVDKPPDQLYFHVEEVKSFTWAKESLKTVEKRRRYGALKVQQWWFSSWPEI